MVLNLGTEARAALCRLAAQLNCLAPNRVKTWPVSLHMVSHFSCLAFCVQGRLCC